MDSIEVVHFDEQSYQLELQAYQIIFHDFKYQVWSFLFVDIR